MATPPLLPELADYCFTHDEMFVVPIEHLSAMGVSAAFAREAQQRVALPAGWIATFNDGFQLYWQRAAALAAAAPQEWMPPQLQHACVVTAGIAVRPYFQPFNQSAWLLYRSDFDPAVSNPEFAAYLFFHMERMGLLRDVTQALVHNLSYWLQRTDAEAAAFAAACHTSPRPDAAGFRALAEALPWIRGVHHDPLSRPLVSRLEPLQTVPRTGLLLSATQRGQLDALLRRWQGAAQATLDAFHATYARRGRDRAGEVCAWLRSARPQVVLSGDGEQVVWDPERSDDVTAVRRVLGGIGAAAATSIRADLEVIDRHSRRFLQSVVHPEQLPAPHIDTAQNGLAYMHRERRCIAYNLFEAGMERLRVPAPPYERLMLGARTVHEWGHLAADAGWIPVAAARRAEYAALHDDLVEQFEAICRDAPPAVRAVAASELARLHQQHGSVGRALAAIPLGRLPDFQANLLARDYLSRAELETYVRNNVYSLMSVTRPAALFQRLARYAYEFQYLRLSLVADPRQYFVESTWFAAEYLQRHVLSEVRLDSLLETVGALCSVFVIDRTQLRP